VLFCPGKVCPDVVVLLSIEQWWETLMEATKVIQNIGEGRAREYQGSHSRLAD